MVTPPPAGRTRIERFPRSAWGVVAVLVLSVGYAILQTGFVRPYLWPAGSGARLAADPTAKLPLMTRPSDVRGELAGPLEVVEIAAGSPAASAGLRTGDRVLAERRADRSAEVTFQATTPSERIAVWRDRYWLGVSGPVEFQLQKTGSPSSSSITLERPAAWATGSDGWAGRHLGMIVQLIVFTAAALVLFALRSYDLTASLCVLALALSAVAGGGPLFGTEGHIPLVGSVLTVFSWLASPFAFPVIALAILHFPTRSPLLGRYPILQAVPLLAAAPMILPALGTSLFLIGIESMKPMAVWDATHPGVFYASFAAALGINVLAVIEGIYRYRFNHDANERRRIRMALYTGAPGILAYAVKDGLPIVATLMGTASPRFSPALYVALQAMVLMPAFGLVYAVGVARVLGPRVVLRRSLQYALATRTLTLLAVLPAIGLLVSLVRDRQKTIGELATSSPGLYVVLIAVSVAAFVYRDRARQWLDQRFFREEYDARKILLSLANRVRFETDPADLATMVVNQLDEALHPSMIAILVDGVEAGQLTPVTSLAQRPESLPLEGGLVSMLRWSDEPLEIFLGDPRSPARRLPSSEREWLERTGAVLMVPVIGQDRSLVAVIALGERRSEEAYTAEDHQLLASIATQIGLGFDVARLRQQSGAGADPDSERTRALSAVSSPMMECPRCGRCEESSVQTCPSDGTTMRAAPSVPRVVENKYRLEQLLGRGGMGAVYRARDMRLDRLVALKVVRAELLGDVEARKRFRREAQIVARLQHPSIVSVYDYGTLQDGGAYIVMELVRGEDLRHVLQREGRLDSQRTLRILTAVCAAIEAAHREGVLHRDLKPENILLPGGSGDAKVLDFGVAKVIENEPVESSASSSDAPTFMTAAGMLIGTPAYMAPEQFQGAPPDTRTDVFSLGVIAYEMLTGELPFGRGSLGEVVLAQARGVPPMKDGHVPAATERAIRTALDPDPDRRPSSPEAFRHLIGASIGLG
jgi:predicted Ser/Thr protein kinase/GAF domain-containing protein